MKHIALIYYSDSSAKSRVFDFFTAAEKYCEKSKHNPDFVFYKIFDESGGVASELIDLDFATK